jgi:hypothetical protein
VAVFEGPIGDTAAESSATDIPLGTRANLWTKFGRWESDAAKRDDMLRWSKEHRRRRVRGAADDDNDPLWILWLDGDEVLLYGEYLRDWCERAAKTTGAGGFPLRLVEMDGSVAKCYGKIVRAGVISRYLQSSYQIELHNGMVVALPNVPICSAGGIPIRPNDLIGQLDPESLSVKLWLSENRPPLMGEPHLLHRSMLRDPNRVARRQHEAEAEFFPEVPA